MIYFNSDYTEGTHEQILQALVRTNMEQTPGYGTDRFCQEAVTAIRRYCRGNPDVHFMVGGTQTNLTVIAASLRPHQCVVCAEMGHINVHETGAIEACGHKIMTIPSSDGKITAKQVERLVQGHKDDATHEHMAQPKVVYITNATEMGEVYTRKELESMREVCNRHNLILYMDGARLGYALGSHRNDLDLALLSELCDVFSIGGTKMGTMFGEAVVISHPGVRLDFRYIMKQKGALLAKGRLLGIQFLEMFDNGLYFELGKQADVLAQMLKEGLLKFGHSVPIDGGTNQVFAIMPNAVIEALEEKYVFEFIRRANESHSMIRMCTSWATKESDVQDLIDNIQIMTSLHGGKD